MTKALAETTVLCNLLRGHVAATVFAKELCCVSVTMLHKIQLVCIRDGARNK